MNYSEVRRLFDYDPETGILTNKINRGVRARAGKEAGGMATGGYRRVGINGKYYYVSRLIWLYVYGKWPNNIVDHNDGICDNNRISNLFDRTCQQNLQNSKKSSDNTSGVTGVYWSKAARKWQSYITLSYKTIHLGCFDNIELANLARKAAEIKYGFNPNHGRRANAE